MPLNNETRESNQRNVSFSTQESTKTSSSSSPSILYQTNDEFMSTNNKKSNIRSLTSNISGYLRQKSNLSKIEDEDDHYLSNIMNSEKSEELKNDTAGSQGKHSFYRSISQFTKKSLRLSEYLTEGEGLRRTRNFFSVDTETLSLGVRLYFWFTTKFCAYKRIILY